MDKILLLSGPLKEVIWGGNYFKNELKVTDSDAKIGEMWSCSGHNSGLSIILNGKYKGQSLRQVFNENKHLFNKNVHLKLLNSKRNSATTE